MRILGGDRLQQIIDELSAPQIKAVLKQGEIKLKTPASYVSQQKRRGLWSQKILAGIEQDNQSLASELLQQWLLNHRRPMLIDFLDRLGVKHRQGETDESFLINRAADQLRSEASWLLGQHDKTETTAYLLYIAYQQRVSVFDDWPELSTSPAPAEPDPSSESN